VPDIPAAVLREYGKPPEFASFEAPPGPSEGQLLVEVEVAGLNPADVALGEQRYTVPSPPVPYVPGSEAVGRVLESAIPGVARGDRVYVDAPALPHGTFASRTLVYGASAYKLTDDFDAATACTLGIVGVSAHGALVHRAQLHPGESVAVLGATGAVGAAAVQIARLLGAESIVAVGRNPARLEAVRELGATATARIGDDDIEAAIRDGAGGDGANIVIDMLCGPPAEAALEAMAVGGRLVQMGRSAAETMEIRSAVVRGRTLSIIGHTYMRMPPEIRHVAYEWLLQKAASGELSVEAETVPLAEVTNAWTRQKSSPGHKLVLAP